MTNTNPQHRFANTARWIAAARAKESRRADCLFSDPFADVFAGKAGTAMLARSELSIGECGQQQCWNSNHKHFGHIICIYIGLFALTHHKIIRMVFGGIFLIVISFHLVRFIFRANWLLGWHILLSLLIVIAYLSLILRYVYKEGPVTRQRLQGAVAAYLLITIAFALGYNLISFLMPGAFRFPETHQTLTTPDSGTSFIISASRRLPH